ncbi:hypothetical protein [Rhizobium miluonense]
MARSCFRKKHAIAIKTKRPEKSGLSSSAFATVPVHPWSKEKRNCSQIDCERLTRGQLPSAIPKDETARFQARPPSIGCMTETYIGKQGGDFKAATIFSFRHFLSPVAKEEKC